MVNLELCLSKWKEGYACLSEDVCRIFIESLGKSKLLCLILVLLVALGVEIAACSIPRNLGVGPFVADNPRFKSLPYSPVGI